MNNENKRQHVRAVMFVMLFANFISALSASILNVAIPSIGIEFNSSPGELNWIISAYMMCLLALLLPAGRFADITNKSIVLIVGFAFFTLTGFATFFATSLEMLIVLRIIQAVGAAGIISTNQAIIVDTVPAEKRGKALGLSVAGTYAGLSVGPVLGGIITYNLGWRWIFMLIACLGTITLVVAIANLPKRISSSGKTKIFPLLDIPGMLLYAIGCLALMYGLNSITGGWIPIALTAAGLILFIFFVLHENRAKTPLLNMSLFRGNKNFLLSNIAALLNYSATFAIAYLVSIYLQIVLGYSADITGIILICAPVVQTIVSVIGGRLSDKYSPFVLSTIGMAFCAAGVTSFIFTWASHGNITHILINLAVVGVGFGFFSSPNTNAIMSMAPIEDRSITSSLIGTMRTFGMAFSMCIITIVLNSYIGKIPIEKADVNLIADSMFTSFIIFAVLCFAGIFFSMGRKSEK